MIRTATPTRFAGTPARRAAGLLGSVAVAASLALAPQAAHAAGVDRSTPDRGADPRVPYLVGDTLMDGGPVARVTSNRVYALDRVRGGWLILRGSTLVRIGSDGTRQRVTGGTSGFETTRAGHLVASTGTRSSDGVDRVRVHRLSDGEKLAVRSFGGSPRVLGIKGRRVLIASGDSRSSGVFWWNSRTGSTDLVSRGEAVTADVQADRLVLRGPRGTQQVVRLSRTDDVLHRLRAMTPLSWNDEGTSYLSTQDYVAEPYLTRVAVKRDSSGATLSTTTRRSTGDYLTQPVWEGTHTWLVVRYDDDGNAFVQRCNRRATACDRASDVLDAETSDDSYHQLISPRILLGTR